VSGEPITGKRWGASWWVRLISWRRRRARAKEQACQRTIRLIQIACQSQQLVDAGFLYAPRCTCGQCGRRIDALTVHHQ
jgi:hypothetical protein